MRSSRPQAYFRCPHCGRGIRAVAARPKPRTGVEWSEVDWSLPTSRIARVYAVTMGYASDMRQKFAPDTIGKIRLIPRVDWSRVDWSLPTQKIAELMGVTISAVSQARRRYSPRTLKRRYSHRRK